MNNIIPIFFSSDKNYLPFASVAIKSLLTHISNKNDYHIYVLTPDIKQADLMMDFPRIPSNVSITAVNIKEKLDSLTKGQNLRDYYSLSIYSRLFIPELFPEYNNVAYLDCDVIINTDIAKLFDTNLGSNYLGCVLDKAVLHCPDFIDYVQAHVGCDNDHSYFNSGVLLMNNQKCRTSNMLQVFYDWMGKNKSTVAPDQDFLNMFCKNKVTYLPSGWNEMPIGQELAGDELYIIHYNMFQKPWKYKGIMYEKYFWNQAQKSIYYRKLKKQQATYTDEQKKNDLTAMEKLIKLTKDIAQKCRKKGPVNA